MANTPNLGMPLVTEGQQGGETTHNDALNFLDMLVQCSVIDRDLTAPPGSPANGDVYIPKATATGAWVGKENDIAGFYDGWIFATPEEGWLAYVRDENIFIKFDGASWVAGPT